MTARRAPARRAAALVVAVVTLLVVAGLAATPAGAAPVQTQTDESAVGRFSACLSAAHSGQVLLLIDESGSLMTSDPQAARVQAARYLLTRLSDLADRSGIQLTAGVAGFSDAFSPPPRWVPLGRATLPDLTGQVDAFAGRDSGAATDYWTALEQSRRALAAQAPPAPAQRCQALFWFSDGRLDLVPGHGAVDPITGTPLVTEADAATAEARERDALCRTGGGALADQLRASGVITFGIGLDTTSRPGEFDLMRGIATGQAGSTPCGRPTDRPPGEFLLAQGIDDLVFDFDALVPPEPISGAARPVCPGAPCAAGAHAFVLDPSVSRVDVLGAVDRSGPDAVLVPPDGTPIPLTPRTVAGGSVTRGPARVTFTWLTDRTVSIEMEPTSRGAGWTGEWALVFVARDEGGQSRANIHITSDLQPAWVNRPPVLHTGDVLPDAAFGLVDPRGAAVDPATVLGDVTIDAALLAPGRPAQPVVAGLAKDRIGRPTGVDLRAVPPGPVTLLLTLRQTTAAAMRPDGTRVPGIALPPRSVSVPLQIAGPVGYPQPAAAVDFGTGEQTTELGGVLDVTGPGCVWVAEQEPRLDAAPAGTGRITVAGVQARDAGSCLRVADGQHAGIDLVLRTEQPGNGALSGTVTVMVAPAGDPAAARAIPVTATADLLLPLNQPVRWAVFVLVFLLGLAIPLALLWLVKFLTGRMPEGQVKAVREPVVVRDGAVVHPDGRPFALDDDRFRAAAAPDPGRRRMSVVGVELRTGGWFSPFGSATVTPRAPGSPLRALVPGRARRARLPLAVHNTWFVLHDPAGSADAAEVVVLLGLVPPAPPGALDRIVAQIRRDLPGLLRGQHPEPARPPEAAPSPAPSPAPAAAAPGHPFGSRHGPGAPGRSPFDRGPDGSGPDGSGPDGS